MPSRYDSTRKQSEKNDESRDLSMGLTEQEYMSNNFDNTPTKISKNRATLNSSKLKDQDTASGMTKTNSLQ